MKTDKGRFDAVLSQMLRMAPKKESEIVAPKKKAKAKRPKPSSR